MDNDEDKNPWFVTNVDAFLYFCCPECDLKDQSKEHFIQHALEKHPRAQIAQNYLFNLQVKEEPDDNYNHENQHDFDNSDLVKTELKEIEEEHNGVFDDEDYSMPEDGPHNEVFEKFINNICVICDKEFDSNNALRNHMASDHQNDTTSKTRVAKNHVQYSEDFIEDEDDLFKCDMCEKSFDKFSLLEQHVKQIHDATVRNNACEFCGKLLATKQSLEIHIARIHEGRKDFNCNHCNKAFSRASDRDLHIRHVHEGSKTPNVNFVIKSSVPSHL